MAKTSVYLPDALAEEAKASGLNLSAVVQAAIREAVAAPPRCNHACPRCCAPSVDADGAQEPVEVAPATEPIEEQQ